ncbi:endonuclease/exonuclease/phosphatase family protein [Phenylobacterium terrae]|uniref:Endonuclease/exonuclease/phosphatase family protein n=1 Tax=Phenylobacterium terrae TaxID=2665495 RepID=A0ABW4N7U5_9CAUL
MSLNGWGGKLHRELIAYLGAAAPDILCLQEVVHSPATDKAWLTYRDGDHVLPQRANLFGEVAAALPDHQAIFCPAAQGMLWDGEVPVPSQWGLATFVSRDLPIVEQAQRFVHKTFSPNGFGEHPRSRNAHAVRVYDFRRGRFVCVVHMHGLRDLAGKADTAERILQAERLADLVRWISSEGDDLVVCGDFNVEPDSQTFQILARCGLTDLVSARGNASTRTRHYTKPGRFADYMLVSPALEGADFSVVYEPEVSDHTPLILEI